MLEKIEKITISTYEEDMLADILKELIPSSPPIHILCIGTDRATGDALGPLVGTLLKSNFAFPYPVHGDLDNPITAENLDKIVSAIPQNDFIIAIDSALGKLNHVGCIQVKRGPLKPGTGVGKDLPSCGNISIMGVVNVGGSMETLILLNTRLAIVWKMAYYIADQVNKAFANTINTYEQAAVSTVEKLENKLDCKV